MFSKKRSICTNIWYKNKKWVQKGASWSKKWVQKGAKLMKINLSLHKTKDKIIHTLLYFKLL